MTGEEILKTEFGIKLTTLVEELDMAIQQRAELNIWVDLERAKGLEKFCGIGIEFHKNR